jgi:hypothetical protein
VGPIAFEPYSTCFRKFTNHKIELYRIQFSFKRMDNFLDLAIFGTLYSIPPKW